MKTYDDDDDDIARKACANEPDMAVFYRIVAAFGNYIRESEDPIAALDEVVMQYVPRGKRPEKWLEAVHDVFIDRWITYAPEIQGALPEGVRASDRAPLAYRDALEFALKEGDWHDAARPYTPK